MKNRGNGSKTAGEQDYFGLTVIELEKSILREHPDSNLDMVKYFLSDWGRLLATIFLLIIMLLVSISVLNINREMSELSKELSFLQTEYARLNEENNQLQIQLSESRQQNELILHSIERGDHFSYISELYYGTADFAPYLAELNEINMNSQLQIGQIIKVPKNIPASWYGNKRPSSPS